MHSKALQAYATIEHLWTGGKDLIEIYAVMAIGALEKAVDNGNKSINAVELAEYFKSEYDLKNVTIGAASKFLQRLEKKHKVVWKENHRFKINVPQLTKYKNDSSYAPDISEDIRRINQDIRDFSQSKHHLGLTEDEVTKGLIDFFDKYGGDLVIEQKSASDVAVIKYRKQNHSQKIKYVISDYIIEQNKADSEVFDTLLKFAIGNMVANAVSLQGFSGTQSNLKNLTVYIDAPIIFNLMNLSGDVPRLMAEDLLSRLKKLQATIVIGASHHEEVISSIRHAINLLNTDFPDRTAANRIYFHAVEKGLTATDLDMILLSFDNIKQKYEIEFKSLPTKEAGYSVLKEDSLRKAIKFVYSDNGRHRVPFHKCPGIKRDAKVLNHVLMLRDGKSGVKLNDAGAILTTNNRALCVAMSSANIHNGSNFPAAILTENLSTLLWTLNPERNIQFQKNALINECIRSLRVKADLLRRFYKDIKSKYNNNAISPEDYHAAVTSKIASHLLLELTFNDQEMYQDETAVEVIRRIKERERIEKENANEANDIQQLRLKDKSRKIANALTLFFGIVLGGIMIWRGIAWAVSDTVLNRIFAIIGVVILGGWGAWNWLKWIPSRDRLTNIIASKIYNWLSTAPKD